ncbi:Glutamine amidotransferase subunit PdxT [Planctopirus ephydatiae]|uniref:Glutamine amidotransferase subunit PdxT n=1 Tax=Planctopirus ephydatiae TaxID=2528019 RepID=A0A518GJW5_9PLAN|nr:BPL-N domain-containing protein [Planctopirus ephydatiae]QDV28892.1 Glutamine amidotransferase subunit PdxT [Planctopirus ephydatiae]
MLMRSLGFCLFLVLSIAASSVTLSVAQAAEPIRVSIYDHSDGSANGPKNLMKFLTEENGFKCVRVSPEEIRDTDILTKTDVLIIPGGSASAQSKKLEDAGCAKIKEFVKNGGGYVGICAGAYLATSDYSWSLGLMNAKVVDKAHWARGTGPVELEMKETGKTLLGESSDLVGVYYGQGPLLSPGSTKELPPYEPLALYATEIAKKGAPSGVMVGTSAIAKVNYGNGRVICYSCHPEGKNGPHHLIKAGARWAAGIDELPAPVASPQKLSADSTTKVD